MTATSITLPRVIRSEWIKLRSVRSTVITLVSAGVAVVAFGLLVSALSNGTSMGGESEVFDPTGNSLAGTNLAQLVLGVLGALFITSEYSTGLIRATLAAVPKRLPVLWAKVVVVTGATFVTMAVAVPIAFVAGQALYGGDGAGASFFDPGVPRALLGAVLLPTAIAAIGVGLGTLLRSTAAAVGVLVGLVFLAPFLLQAFGGVGADLAGYLPAEAGQAMTTLAPRPDQLSPGLAFGVMVAWVAGFVGAAAFALRRRDV